MKLLKGEYYGFDDNSDLSSVISALAELAKYGELKPNRVVTELICIPS
jgi:hypothetical protein